MSTKPSSPLWSLHPNASRIARRVLLPFLITFVASRVLVILIMERKMPDLFFHMGGTHIHHLNYGIFLLSALGAVFVFFHLSPRGLAWVTRLYGVGLALTFDEFGMWLHLGGGYWQRASFDAMIVLASLLGLASAAPALRKWGTRSWLGASALVVACILFYWMLASSFKFAAREEPRLQLLEESGPP